MEIDLSLKIDRVESISREEFQKKYMIPQKPVIIKHFYGKDAPLYSKWSFDYFKKRAGKTEIGIYDDETTQRKDDRSYKSADEKMLFEDYLSLIEAEPTTKRIFLFNIFKHIPEMREDFEYPSLASNYLKKLPFVFFGGKGAVTRIHQDMDFSNVFLTELTGKKRVVLFSPEYSDQLYRYPFGVHSSVNPLDPDYNKYPELQHVQGYDLILEKGETLFMPSGYWHHIEYLEASFGIAIRSLSPNYTQRIRGLYNVAVMTHIDELMRYAMKDRWFDWKIKTMNKRARRA